MQQQLQNLFNTILPLLLPQPLYGPYDYLRELAPEETFTHSPIHLSWSSSNLYQRLQSTMIHSNTIVPANYLRSTATQTRHRASTSMYSLTFCVRFLLPERHQRKPTVQAAAVMLRTPPVDGQSPASQPRPLPIYGAQFWERPLSPTSQRPAARADPVQPAIRTMSSYRGMDASL